MCPALSLFSQLYNLKMAGRPLPGENVSLFSRRGAWVFYTWPFSFLFTCLVLGSRINFDMANTFMGERESVRPKNTRGFNPCAPLSRCICFRGASFMVNNFTLPGKSTVGRHAAPEMRQAQPANIDISVTRRVNLFLCSVTCPILA